jgi:N-acetyl-gamma-glutamyl-phosphate reductase
VYKINMVAGIIGATGYAGAELVRLLPAHSKISGLILASVRHHGESITAIYPNFMDAGGTRRKFGKGILEKPEDLIAHADIVFGALPAGTGEPYARACLDRGISYIDLAADFRFDDDEETYTAWYGKSWQYPELRKRSVYGLPELNRRRIQELAASGPVVIGNPGCYPTAVSLACYPAVAADSGGTTGALKLAPGAAVIADAVSGVSGAGREPARAYHYPECADAVSAYKVGAHRHIPEISRNLSKMAGKSVPLVFTPHLGPFNRGILATVYLPLEAPLSTGPSRPQTKELAGKAAVLREQYTSFYKDEPFVRILPENITAATNRVRQSNFCDLSVHLDQSGTVLIVESAIDNMVKGAAGQAIENMNIICGFEESTGLEALPALF